MDLSVEDIDRARRWLTRFVKKQDVELINAICDKAPPSKGRRTAK